MVLDEESLQEYTTDVGVLQGSTLGTPTFLLLIHDLPDEFICNIGIYADDTTLFSKFEKASDLWQQLQLASELKFNLGDTSN